MESLSKETMRLALLGLSVKGNNAIFVPGVEGHPDEFIYYHMGAGYTIEADFDGYQIYRFVEEFPYWLSNQDNGSVDRKWIATCDTFDDVLAFLGGFKW